jgi:predicted  nucleic acid-binding Zn-ribbon protein
MVQLKSSGAANAAESYFSISNKIKEIQDKTVNLTTEEKQEIEKDVFDLIGSEIDVNEPVVLDIESIRVLKPGKYELDLVHLFKNEPLIFKLEEGKYMIDVIETFRKFAGKKKNN